MAVGIAARAAETAAADPAASSATPVGVSEREPLRQLQRLGVHVCAFKSLCRGIIQALNELTTAQKYYTFPTSSVLGCCHGSGPVQGVVRTGRMDAHETVCAAPGLPGRVGRRVPREHRLQARQGSAAAHERLFNSAQARWVEHPREAALP